MKLRRDWELYSAATGFALLEHSRNRLALVLTMFFVPAWAAIVHGVITSEDVAFYLRASDEWITAPGNQINSIGAVLNTVTALAGFLMFSSTFHSARFDQRLVAAGYRPMLLISAKLTALVVSAALLAAYGTLALCLHWSPEQPLLLGVSVFGAAMAYGGIGVMLGVLLRGELEGMFTVIMLSIVDSTLQNPVINSEADGGIPAFMPSYGSMQSGVAAGFLDSYPLSYVALGALWFAAAVVVAGLVLAVRSRDRRNVLLSWWPRVAGRPR